MDATDINYITIQGECADKSKLQDSISQLNEWAHITESVDSVKSYKTSLVNLLAVVQDSYKLEPTNNDEIELNKSEDAVSVDSKIQLHSTNVMLTLDELAEQLFRIEHVQTYLSTLRTEAVKNSDDYEQMVAYLKSFISEIENIENEPELLSRKRFQIISNADYLSTVLERCEAQDFSEINQKKSVSSQTLVPIAQAVSFVQNQSSTNEKNNKINEVQEQEQETIPIILFAQYSASITTNKTQRTRLRIQPKREE